VTGACLGLRDAEGILYRKKEKQARAISMS
jgi:hypothetical protein